MAPPIIPFFKLPAVARAAAIQGWEVDQVIESAMLSDTFREQVESYRYSCEKLSWNITEHPSILITNKQTILYIRFKNMDDQTYTPVRKINGTYHFFNKEPIQTNWNRIVHWYFHVDENTLECKMRMMNEVTKFLMKILKDASFNLMCDLGDPSLEIKDLFIWKYIKSFTRINIQDPYKCPGPNISAEELVFLLEEIKAEDRSMNLNVADFKYDKPIQGKDIRLNDMNWVTTECLKGPEVVEIFTNGGSINSNEIIRHWVNGGCPNLETIQMYSNGFQTETVQVFDGLNKKPTVFTESDFCTRNSSSRPESTYDIQRKGDGRVCSIYKDGNYMLEMIVWHQKHFSLLEPKTRARLKLEYGIQL